MFKPEGIYVAMMTPFEGGRINEAVVRQMVDFVIERGVHGIFPVGSVGEFVHLGFEEKVFLMQIVHDQARGRVPVTPGITSTRPEDSIRLAKKAREIGCEAVVIAPPYYYPLSQENMERYFETVSDAIDLPIILYNIPLFAPPIGTDLVERLSRRKNIVAMKDSSGSMVDLLHYMDKVRLIGEDLSFLVGREDILFPALMVGAKGCMTATSGILPEIMVGIYNAWRDGDYEKARELQLSILLLIRAMFSVPFPLGFKTALEVRGFKMGPPQQPLSDAEYSRFAETKNRIQEIMKVILHGLNS
ncbi:MAG: dihydrodipicolinate synthase family protein [Syntrophaceae bacterium]|nr:dihydrodipicolinate synthase family protein [Syntrophaceae bacterium]